MPDMALPRAGEHDVPLAPAPRRSEPPRPAGRPDGGAPLEMRKRYLKSHHSSGVDWVTLLAGVLLVWGVMVLAGFVR